MFFYKMAPRKVKSQGKKTNLKIKSKINKAKCGIKTPQKLKITKKPLKVLPWLKKVPAEGVANQCEGIPTWLNSCGYKRDTASCSTVYNSNCRMYGAKDKSVTSEESDECACSFNSKPGILKRRVSSTSSLVAKYLKSGMDHVASFIVESAIRFGEQHGVVVPDKNFPNTYNITTPDSRFDEKCRKIRFQVPERKSESFGMTARPNFPKTATTFLKEKSFSDDDHKCRTTPASWQSSEDSLEEILPVIEKLKKSGGVIRSELDLDQFARSKITENHMRKRERPRERVRVLGKRFKSVGDVSQRNSEDTGCTPEGMSRWKRIRRDSVELGRQRLRAATCPRKQSRSPSLY